MSLKPSGKLWNLVHALDDLKGLIEAVVALGGYVIVRESLGKSIGVSLIIALFLLIVADVVIKIVRGCMVSKSLKLGQEEWSDFTESDKEGSNGVSEVK